MRRGHIEAVAEAAWQRLLLREHQARTRAKDMERGEAPQGEGKGRAEDNRGGRRGWARRSLWAACRTIGGYTHEARMRMRHRTERERPPEPRQTGQRPRGNKENAGQGKTQERRHRSKRDTAQDSIRIEVTRQDRDRSDAKTGSVQGTETAQRHRSERERPPERKGDPTRRTGGARRRTRRGHQEAEGQRRALGGGRKGEERASRTRQPTWATKRPRLRGQTMGRRTRVEPRRRRLWRTARFEQGQQALDRQRRRKRERAEQRERERRQRRGRVGERIATIVGCGMGLGRRPGGQAEDKRRERGAWEAGLRGVRVGEA